MDQLLSVASSKIRLIAIIAIDHHDLTPMNTSLGIHRIDGRMSTSAEFAAKLSRRPAEGGRFANQNRAWTDAG